MARKSATHCALYKCAFDGNAVNGIAQAHHSHHVSRPEYRDPNIPNAITFLCAPCNLALSTKNYILVVMMGVKKTVFHLILDALKSRPSLKITIIPRKSEDFLAIYVPKLFRTFDFTNFIQDELMNIVHHFNTE